MLRWMKSIFATLLNNRSTQASAEESLSEVEEVSAMKPIVSSFCIVNGGYYILVTLNRFWTESGQGLVLMASLSALTMLAGFYFYFFGLKNTRRVYQLNIASLTINFLLYLNPVVFQSLHFGSDRLKNSSQFPPMIPATSASAKPAADR